MIVFRCACFISDSKPSTKVPYTSSVMMMRSLRLVATISPTRLSVLGAIAYDGGLLGLTTKNAFTVGSSDFVDLAIRILPGVRTRGVEFGGVDLDDFE